MRYFRRSNADIAWRLGGARRTRLSSESGMSIQNAAHTKHQQLGVRKRLLHASMLADCCKAQ